MSTKQLTAFFDNLSQAEETAAQLRAFGVEDVNLIQFEVNDEQDERDSLDTDNLGLIVGANPSQGSGTTSSMGAGGGLLGLPFVNPGFLNTAKTGQSQTRVTLETRFAEQLMEKVQTIIEDRGGRID